ncbi:hypothetical protein [Roseicella frigidaeris]|uniref:Uncharacterized protein n=1 Tax=Roseicella frigidaeris TaxID=2230885 RepID=A0A327MC23_9PROT|nr:hypothetical protein [Roseicella frigidaeris]RAI59573.1 hypothetical protein DOO78_08240 [Roseicella frigidaeris]
MTVIVAGNGLAPPGLPLFALPVPHPAPGWGLLAAALAVLPAARGRAALLLPDHPRLGADPARRRMAGAVLQEAAAAGGGTPLRAQGGTLLLGTSEASARRAAAALGTLLGQATPLPVWLLPRDADAVLGWAAAQAPARDDRPASGPPPPGLLHAALDGLSADAVLRAEVLRDAAGARRGQRLRLSRRAVAAALGPLAADPDLLAQAMERMAARLRPGLAAWARDLPGLRLVPLARDALPAPALRPGAIGVLPLAAAAGPDFPGFRARLAERGWAVALAGLEAATLALADPAALPATLLLLRWSPALAALPPAPGPDRLVLETGGDPAAAAFARERGLLLVGAA